MSKRHAADVLLGPNPQHPRLLQHSQRANCPQSPARNPLNIVRGAFPVQDHQRPIRRPVEVITISDSEDDDNEQVHNNNNININNILNARLPPRNRMVEIIDISDNDEDDVNNNNNPLDIAILGRYGIDDDGDDDDEDDEEEDDEEDDNEDEDDDNEDSDDEGDDPLNGNVLSDDDLDDDDDDDDMDVEDVDDLDESDLEDIEDNIDDEELSDDDDEIDDYMFPAANNLPPPPPPQNDNNPFRFIINNVQIPAPFQFIQVPPPQPVPQFAFIPPYYDPFPVYDLPPPHQQLPVHHQQPEVHVPIVEEVVLEADDTIQQPEVDDEHDGDDDGSQSAAYRKLLKLQNARIISNGQPFECTICFTNIAKGEGVVLQDCLHEFCRDCLQAHIQHSEETKIKCPFNNGDYACESYLLDREIRRIAPPEVFEKYLARSLQIAESTSGQQAFHCKTADCAGWVLVEGNQVERFTCPVCGVANCVKCKAVHTGLTCELFQLQVQSQNDPAARATSKYLQDMLKNGKAMTCPKCSAVCLKDDGCDAITCAMCRVQLCWATKGLRWGPKGYGDYSGGCGCRNPANGMARCHKKCRNCH